MGRAMNREYAAKIRITVLLLVIVTVFLKFDLLGGFTEWLKAAAIAAIVVK